MFNNCYLLTDDLTDGRRRIEGSLAAVDSYGRRSANGNSDHRVIQWQHLSGVKQLKRERVTCHFGPHSDQPVPTQTCRFKDMSLLTLLERLPYAFMHDNTRDRRNRKTAERLYTKTDWLCYSTNIVLDRLAAVQYTQTSKNQEMAIPSWMCWLPSVSKKLNKSIQNLKNLTHIARKNELKHKVIRELVCKILMISLCK